jgi:hypothetical protein
VDYEPNLQLCISHLLQLKSLNVEFPRRRELFIWGIQYAANSVRTQNATRVALLDQFQLPQETVNVFTWKRPSQASLLDWYWEDIGVSAPQQRYEGAYLNLMVGLRLNFFVQATLQKGWPPKSLSQFLYSSAFAKGDHDPELKDTIFARSDIDFGLISMLLQHGADPFENTQIGGQSTKNDFVETCRLSLTQSDYQEVAALVKKHGPRRFWGSSKPLWSKTRSGWNFGR